MSDQFELFVKHNREKFDYYEPDVHCWNRIIKRSNAKRYILIPRNYVWKVAAISIVVVTLSLLTQRIIINQNSQKTAAQSSQIAVPELMEAEAFYGTQLNIKLAQAEQLLQDKPELAQNLKYDMALLDSIYADLKNDLKDGIANEEVIDAMIQNYKIKLEILEELLQQLQNNSYGTDRENEATDERRKVKL